MKLDVIIINKCFTVSIARLIHVDLPFRGPFPTFRQLRLVFRASWRHILRLKSEHERGGIERRSIGCCSVQNNGEKIFAKVSL